VRRAVRNAPCAKRLSVLIAGLSALIARLLRHERASLRNLHSLSSTSSGLMAFSRFCNTAESS
jgi:hypothetical protein